MACASGSAWPLLFIKALIALFWLTFQSFLWQAHSGQGLPNGLLERFMLNLHHLTAFCTLIYTLISKAAVNLGSQAVRPSLSQQLPFVGLLALFVEPTVHQTYVVFLASSCGLSVLPRAQQLLHPRDAFNSWLPLDWLHGTLQSAVCEVSAGRWMWCL